MTQLHLAENLRTLSGYGKSVSEVCRRAGVNRSQFNRYLSGSSRPSLQSLRRICDFFGVDEHEVLLPPDDFRAIVRLRPPQMNVGDDKAADFVQGVFLDQRRPAAQPGYYLGYIMPEPGVPAIYVHLVNLSWTGRGTTVKIVARFPEGQINLPRRLTFEGAAFEQAGKLFCLVRERRRRRAASCIVLSLGDFEAPALMDGVITGTEPESGNDITSFRVVWRYIGAKPDLRRALRQCGVFPPDQIDLPELVRLTLADPI